MERQLLEIQDAFAAFVDDAERQRLDAEGRLREAERQKKDMEDRLRTIERQKHEAEDQLRETAGQLRKLQKTPAVRIVRFFRRLNPVTIGAEANRLRRVGATRFSAHTAVSCAVVDRRKPFRLGEIVERVGVEERIERFGRPCDGRKPVARGPLVDLAEAFDDEGLRSASRKTTLHSPMTG